MEVKCEIIEETHDDIICDEWKQWAEEVCSNVWTESEDGSLVIDESARRHEIAKRAYFRWKNGSNNEKENWLEAEREVEAALFN